MTEEDRLDALYSCEVLDTPADDRCDRITRLAARLFDTPIALISLVDRERLWFKSHIGFAAREMPRVSSFCSHAIEAAAASTAPEGHVLVVPDAMADPQFAANPLVTGAPGIRFYAGAMLTTPAGHNVGALCVIDTRAHEEPSESELAILRTLASFAMDEFDLARRTRRLEEREQLFRLSRAMAAIGHWRYSAKARRLTWSDELYAIHAFDRAGFAPTLTNVAALYRPSQGPCFSSLVERALDNGEGFTTRLTFSRADGTTRYLDCKAMCQQGETGEVTAVLGLLQDVTDHVEASNRADDSEAKFRLLAEHAADMVSRVSQDGQRLYVSPACEALFGLKPDELVRNGVLDRIHPADVAIVTGLQADLLSGRADVATRTFRAVKPGGQTLWIESSVKRVIHHDSGAPDGYISVLRDVSSRQAVIEALRSSEERLRIANTDLEQLTRRLTLARDEAERASEAKSRFLASMSHELRTPLHGILGYAQMIRHQTTLSADQTTWTDAMLDAGTHLLDMINSVLNLSSIEAGAAKTRLAWLTVDDLVASCLDLVRPKAQAKGLSLLRDVPPGVPNQLRTDPMRLRQILINLLGNAVKFTSSGEVTLRVRLATDGAALRFGVADTGPGIPAEQRDRAFLEFERLVNATASGEEGIGLGLAISARLACQLGSRLCYEDGAAGGSVFYFELALDADNAQQSETESVAHSTPEKPAELEGVPQLKVLVVDDVEMNRDIACAFLRRAGHEAAVASSGLEALATAASTDFDVILMDLRMPGMDGLEATRRIRALGGRRSRVPIVALTAQAFSEHVQQSRAAGMDGHLAKPFRAPDMLAVVLAAARNRVGVDVALPIPTMT